MPDFDSVVGVHLADLVEDGGGPVGTALATLARLGARAGYIGLLGDDREGRFLSHSFARDGVDLHRLRVDPGAGTNVCIILVQQSTGRVSGSDSGMTVRPADDALEQEANALANQAASSGPAGQGQDVQRNRRIGASTLNEGSTANTGIEDTDTLTAVVKIRPEKQLLQRNGTKWEQYTWLFNPNEPIPIMTGNEYADWIEHGGKEPTSMNCSGMTSG